MSTKLFFFFWFKGDLMNKARLKVTSDGFLFAKGKSRSKSGSEAESETSPIKRAKLSSEERSREIKLLQENLKTLNNRLSFKRQQLEKERCMSNYKQCDAISAEMIKIRKERASTDRQLSALMKKEAKSSWYHKNSTKDKKKVFSECKGKQVPDNQTKLPCLLKKSSSSSSSTDDTIILSDPSVDNIRDSQSSCDENLVISCEETQNFWQTPPKIAINQAEGTQNQAEGTQNM